jgi:peptidoglycan LD-endopeptidase LytH
MIARCTLWKLVPPALVLLFLAQGCGPVQPSLLGRRTPHEVYADGLRKAGLEATALAAEWQAAAGRALVDTVLVTAPYRSSLYFPADHPTAFGFRIDVRRGERVRVLVEPQGAPPARVFVDVFAMRSRGEPEHVVSADDRVLEFVAKRDRQYVLRVQPELLRSVRVAVTITTGASLEFPVAGHDAKSIRSFFGDARDGGKRRHEGVDAFATKGTPLIAVASGTARAANNRLGGKVLWLYDRENDITLYYAHLDSQYVGLLSRVQVGDTIGTVGNTGNAAHTPPHLHFGIYARGEGAVDPLPFLNTPRQEAPPITADTSLLGERVRVSARRAELRTGPGGKAPVLATLPQHTHLHVLAASADRYRVRLGEITGYVQAREVVPLSTAIRRVQLERDLVLLAAPAIDAVPVRELPAGGQVEVLAVQDDFDLVRVEGEVEGWMLRQ